jgi:hypothetical protein
MTRYEMQLLYNLGVDIPLVGIPSKTKSNPIVYKEDVIDAFYEMPAYLQEIGAELIESYDLSKETKRFRSHLPGILCTVYRNKIHWDSIGKPDTTYWSVRSLSMPYDCDMGWVIKEEGMTLLKSFFRHIKKEVKHNDN